MNELLHKFKLGNDAELLLEKRGGGYEKVATVPIGSQALGVTTSAQGVGDLRLINPYNNSTIGPGDLGWDVGGGISPCVFATSFSGVDPSGMTDCTYDLNAALASVPEGTNVFFASGTYVAATRLTVPKTTITGSWAATIKTPSGATSHINDACVRILADDCAVENLQLDGNKAGNAAIDDFDIGRWADGVAVYADRARVKNNRIRDTIGHKVIVWNEPFVPTGKEKGARSFFTIEGNHITGVGQRASIDVASTDYSAPVNHNGIIRGNIIENMTVIVHTGYDLLIEGNVIRDLPQSVGGINVHTNSKRVRVVNNMIGPCSVGISTHNFCEDLAFVGNKISSTAGIAIMVADCARATVDDNTIYGTGSGAPAISFQPVTGGSIRGNTIHGAGNHSISLSNNSSDIVVSDNKSSSPAAYHVNVAGATDVTIRDNSFKGGSIGIAATTGTNTGLVIESNTIKGTSANGIYTISPDVLIRDNTIRSAGAHAIRIQGQGTHVVGNDVRDTTGAGINIAAAVTGIVITDNYLANSSGGNLVGRQPDTIVRHNIGYVTEARGNATIADGTSSIVVNHGLAAEPTSVIPAARGSEAVWISARTAATFTISRAGTAGALVVDWQAEI